MNVSRETDSPSPTLALSDASLRYRGGSSDILKGINLQLRTGEFVALVGANGSGKSSLLRLLSGSRVPNRGTVILGGVPLKQIPTQILARQIAFVAQENPAPFAFTVEELVALGAGAAISESRDARVSDALNRFGLESIRSTSLLALSGGQRQRAHIARGWAQGTPFLLLDEPLAHLDIGHQRTLLTLLREHAVKLPASVVAAIHDLNLAASFAHRMILLHLGEIVADGAPATVLTAENIRTAYGVDAHVGRNPRTGAPWIWPEQETASVLGSLPDERD